MIISEKKFFYDSRYGFLENHSTEFAALELTDKALRDMDEKKITLAILVDLSKAFDTPKSLHFN